MESAAAQLAWPVVKADVIEYITYDFFTQLSWSCIIFFQQSSKTRNDSRDVALT